MYFRALTSPRRPSCARRRHEQPDLQSGFQIYLEAASKVELPAWFHFGFFVESDLACRELYDRMQRDQVRIVRQLVSEPFTNYFCADPDGHLVQIYFDPHAA